MQDNQIFDKAFFIKELKRHALSNGSQEFIEISKILAALDATFANSNTRLLEEVVSIMKQITKLNLNCKDCPDEY